MPTALVVADSRWTVNDVLAALSLGDWDVEVVDDPTLAAAMVGELAPDVVIVDLQVRSMGGMAVVRDIRARPGDDPLPRLIMLLDRSADVFLARRAGADAWVVKPFEAEQLRHALKRPEVSSP